MCRRSSSSGRVGFPFPGAVSKAQAGLTRREKHCQEVMAPASARPVVSLTQRATQFWPMRSRRLPRAPCNSTAFPVKVA